MRLIDADEFESYLIGRYGGDDTGDDIIDDLHKQPTVDAVQIVRCKDCKHRNARTTDMVHCTLFRLWIKDDFFCKDGERRSE